MWCAAAQSCIWCRKLLRHHVASSSGSCWVSAINDCFTREHCAGVLGLCCYVSCMCVVYSYRLMLHALRWTHPMHSPVLQEPPCVLALGTETLGSGSLVMGLGANSTLTDRLNTALLQLGEAGYLSGQSGSTQLAGKTLCSLAGFFVIQHATGFTTSSSCQAAM